MTGSAAEEAIFTSAVKRKLLVLTESHRARLEAVALPGPTSEQSYVFGPPDALTFYAEEHRAGSVLEGLRVHPGEHHALLPLRRAAPAVLVPRAGWRSHDASFCTFLERLPRLSTLGAKEWKWYLSGTHGSTFVRPNWCLQLHPAPGGVHVAMIGMQPEPLDYSRMIGVGVFRAILAELAAALPPGDGTERTDEPAPSQFGQRALAYLAHPTLEQARAAPSATALSEAFARLGAVESRELTAASTREKRRALARKLLPLLGVTPIEAVLGQNEWLFMPPRDLVALTRDGLVGRYDGCLFAAPWSECREVMSPTATAIFVRTTRAQWLPLPAVSNAPRVADAIRPLLS